MAQLHPITISSELIDRIDCVYATQSVLLDRNDLTYRRLIRDCNNLKHADAVEGWIIHGLCELLVGDDVSLRSCFDNARAVAGASNDKCDFMFMQALIRIGCRAEALDLFRRIGVPEAGLFGQCAVIGEWIGAYELVDTMHQRAQEMNLEFQSDADFAQIHRIRDVLHADGISDADVAQFLDIASRPLWERRLIQKGHNACVLDLDGRDVVMVTFDVDADGTTLADMTFELAEMVAVVPEWKSTFHVSYRAYQDGR